MTLRSHQYRNALAVISAAAPSTAFAKSNGIDGFTFVVGLFALGGAIWLFQSMLTKATEARVKLRLAELEADARAKQDEADQRNKAALEALEEREAAMAQQHRKLLREVSDREAAMRGRDEAFKASYVGGRQWLAAFIAEAFMATDRALALELESKKNPAKKAADEVRRIGAEKRQLTERLKMLEYQLKTYHEYYPVLEEYSEDILNEQATLVLDDDAEDAVARYISTEEYERLDSASRNQLALQKWKARARSSVEIGRMYERYLGYLYEQDGWEVTYFGAIRGLEDMGRDLICRRRSQVHVVQAKNWAKHRTIHEKHIFQLYGTTLLLPRSHPELEGKRVVPVFVTTTKLSDTARWAAEQLKVQVRETSMDLDYPMVKCNKNGRSKIYHLPFDQQYDRVKVERDKGEFYVATAMEAERQGFRRALRHHAAAR